MSTPFDSTTKQLLKWEPHAWLKLLGIEAEDVQSVNSDMSAVAGAADFAIKVRRGALWEAVHAEVQSRPDPHMDDRMLFYSAVIGRDENIGVRSFLILLRRAADSPKVTGHVVKRYADGATYLEFRYHVIRMWEMPPDTCLTGALGLLPLAFIADVKKEQLPEMVRRATERIDRETTKSHADELWIAVANLLGLNYEMGFIMKLLEYVANLKDSSFYQGVLAEGEARGKLGEARAILMRMGQKKFGALDAASLSAFNAIDSLQRLEDLSDRMLIVGSWSELLGK